MNHLNINNFKEIINPISSPGWRIKETDNVPLGDVWMDKMQKLILIHPEEIFAFVFKIWGVTDLSVNYCQEIAIKRVHTKIDKTLASIQMEHFNNSIVRSINNITTYTYSLSNLALLSKEFKEIL